MLNRFCAGLAFLLLKCFYGFEVKGRENIPKKGGFLLVSNHRSYLDPIVLAAGCPRKLNFMAREDLFHKPWVRRFLLALCAFPVKRDSADSSALKEGIRRIKRGNALLVFPEATRVSEGEKISPKAGVGFLAVKSEAVIVPAYVLGTDKALPKGSKNLKFAKISLCFGKPVFIDTTIEYQDVADAIMKDVHNLSSVLA